MGLKNQTDLLKENRMKSANLHCATGDLLNTGKILLTSRINYYLLMKPASLKKKKNHLSHLISICENRPKLTSASSHGKEQNEVKIWS